MYKALQRELKLAEREIGLAKGIGQSPQLAQVSSFRGDGNYYAEDQNEDDVVWKLFLEVADNEVSARITFEGCGVCKGKNEGNLECGSTKLDTEGEFELWCGTDGSGGQQGTQAGNAIVLDSPGTTDEVTSARSTPLPLSTKSSKASAMSGSDLIAFLEANR